MEADTLPLVVGLPGLDLNGARRKILETVRPAGVVLFSRNVEAAPQVRGLVEELRDLDPAPFLAIDLEGGAVNRLAGLWGTLPSPARASAAGRKAVRALGEAAGAACRSLGIHLDLAPVVDLVCSDGMVAREGRCLSDDPDRVVTLARVFAEGLASWCVGGCLKHFPGLGPASVDTHRELPVFDQSEEQLQPHLEVFRRLSETIPVVMVGHVVVPALGDAERPASLSGAVVEKAASLPGHPVVLSDDIEMDALEGFGDLPTRVTDAFRARNHGVLVCRAFAQLEEIADGLRQSMEEDPTLRSRMDDNISRLGTFSRDLCRTAASVPAPDDDDVARLWEKARQAAEP